MLVKSHQDHWNSFEGALFSEGILIQLLFFFKLSLDEFLTIPFISPTLHWTYKCIEFLQPNESIKTEYKPLITFFINSSSIEPNHH